MMNLNSLLECLQQVAQRKRDYDVAIEITKPFTTVGGSPYVEVKSVRVGFDWDAGRIFLVPETPLTNEGPDFAIKFKELQSKAGWLEYENRGLKSENRRLKKLMGKKND